MTDQPTHRKALQALKEARQSGIEVKAVRVKGREFELVLVSGDDDRDDFDLAKLR